MVAGLLSVVRTISRYSAFKSTRIRSRVAKPLPPSMTAVTAAQRRGSRASNAELASHADLPLHTANGILLLSYALLFRSRANGNGSAKRGYCGRAVNEEVQVSRLLERFLRVALFRVCPRMVPPSVLLALDSNSHLSVPSLFTLPRPVTLCWRRWLTLKLDSTLPEAMGRPSTRPPGTSTYMEVPTSCVQHDEMRMPYAGASQAHCGGLSRGRVSISDEDLFS